MKLTHKLSAFLMGFGSVLCIMPPTKAEDTQITGGYFESSCLLGESPWHFAGDCLRQGMEPFSHEQEAKEKE